MNRELLEKLYFDAVEECEEPIAWLFEEKFTEIVLKEIKQIIADCCWKRPEESAAYMLWVEEEIMKHFYGENYGKK